MAVYQFLCLECGRTFDVDSRMPIEGTQVRCALCDATHVRQTFESHLRNAKAAWSPRHLEELRCNHFG